MSITAYDDEKRLEINLIASSSENVGETKLYDRIIGCLLAYAGKYAVELYAEYACINLVPKTRLASYYESKYGFMLAGRSLFMDYPQIVYLISLYLENEGE